VNRNFTNLGAWLQQSVASWTQVFTEAEEEEEEEEEDEEEEEEEGGGGGMGMSVSGVEERGRPSSMSFSTTRGGPPSSPKAFKLAEAPTQVGGGEEEGGKASSSFLPPPSSGTTTINITIYFYFFINECPN
jgi:hypothetical protein